MSSKLSKVSSQAAFHRSYKRTLTSNYSELCLRAPSRFNLEADDNEELTVRKRKGTYCPKNVSTPTTTEVKTRTPKTDCITKKMEDVSFVDQ